MNPPSAAPPRLRRYFGDYASHHKHPANLVCHEFGIPMIAIALLGLLARIGLGFPVGDGALILLLVSWAWLAFLDWKLLVPFGLTSLGLYFLGLALPLSGLIVLFFGGWIAQGIGHLRFERNRPAFFAHFWHLLIGPFWLFARLVGYSAE